MSFEVEIQAGAARVKGPNAQFPGLLEIEFTLSARPSQHWQTIFNRTPPNVSYPLSIQRPQVLGDTVTVLARDEDVERARDLVVAFVAATNVDYNKNVAPELQRRHDARAKQAEERNRRVEEAQKRLDSGTDGVPSGSSART